MKWQIFDDLGDFKVEYSSISTSNARQFCRRTFGDFDSHSYNRQWMIEYRAHAVKKEDIWLSPMTKALTPTEKSKKELDNTKTPPKNFDYTTIADPLRTVSWGNDSHPTGVVKQMNGIPTLPLTATVVLSMARTCRYYFTVTVPEIYLTIWNRRDLLIYSNVLNLVPNHGTRILSLVGHYGLVLLMDIQVFCLMSSVDWNPSLDQ